MKITYMLKREDFYSINQRTLDSCFPGNGKRTHLYIYPELNAIVTAQPSKKVRDYLLCEYSVRASRIKRSLVKAYVRLCLVSRGILSSMSMYVHGDVGKGILIYPCNKKYRIFNFDSGTVEVVIKNGFPSRTIQHEVIFRNQPDLPDFVPMLISSTESRYQERIIDGCPLPRISAGFESYRGAAYKLLNEFAETCSEKTSGSKYSELLRMQINALITDKVRDKQKLTRITQALCGVVSQTDTIDVRFSHGDFQAGNIWVENRTNKIFIIDWESWGKRSGWYDKAAL